MNPMKLEAATSLNFEKVRNIILSAINNDKDLFLEDGTRYFHEKNTDEIILWEINSKRVFLVKYNGEYIATFTISENRVKRFFVLPEYRHLDEYQDGISQAMEKYVGEKYPEIIFEVTLADYRRKVAQGYFPFHLNQITTQAGNNICLYTLKKDLIKK